MMAKGFFLFLATAAALQLPRVPLAAPPLARARAPLLQEKPVPSEELSAEQIVAAAEKAGEPVGAESWPEMKPIGGQTELAEDVESKEAQFDPRFVLYVSLPALVLGGQLFFTFSRDALGDAALGPAIMN